MASERAVCEQLDRDDPLAHHRNGFVLPAGVIYLDGNSLGPLPKATAARVQDVVASGTQRGDRALLQSDSQLVSGRMQWL